MKYPRALALCVVAIALGVYVLQLGNGHGAAATGAPPMTTTTTTAPPSGATTTTVPAPTASVKVLVANASDANGVAGYFTTKLAADGWGTLTATTATARVTASTVYYATGEQAEAALIASELGLAGSAVQPLSASVPVQGTTGASVVVVAGNDLAAAVPATTTTA